MVRFYRVAWGLIGPTSRFADAATFVRDPHSNDFDGVEFPAFLMDAAEAGRTAAEAAFGEALADTGLDYIGQIATRPEAFGDATAQRRLFREQLEDLSRMGVKKAAAQAGADSFPLDEAMAFFRECLAMANDHGVDVCFETHRARPFYNPWTTRDLLEALPDLRLTGDFSHWMAVIDRWPHDCMELFEEAAKRSGHIHARVGHEKGPQIVDPRDPLWSEHIALHMRWWQIALDAAKDRGEDLTISPEFGPPPYMTTQPFTGEPLADLVEINAHVLGLLKSTLLA